MRTSIMPWDELPFATLTNVLFVVLVLGMPIIMMNTVGLAVGDIDKIQQNALMDRYVLQVQLLLTLKILCQCFFLNTYKCTVTQIGGCSRVVWQTESTEVEEEEALSPGMLQIIGKVGATRKKAEMLKELKSHGAAQAREEKSEEKKDSKDVKMGLFGF
ncbi:hypothetical protein OS493_025073 [Desmophyllum pertusum]|uniref:Uncharacterized protein n=1 Tax=Desmophyllum pertusum TaxID=174260 RepID=A0A9W9YA22_9CNID|nr:hypothetical protein OS493_025073 [Desmophyllum pertusum]